MREVQPVCVVGEYGARLHTTGWSAMSRWNIKGPCAFGLPRYRCARCKVSRTFRTWLNGNVWELRCSVCRWVRERKQVQGEL